MENWWTVVAVVDDNYEINMMDVACGDVAVDSPLMWWWTEWSLDWLSRHRQRGSVDSAVKYQIFKMMTRLKFQNISVLLKQIRFMIKQKLLFKQKLHLFF